ncbi:efflux RND transporter periplasmic adaptor subunit [candidate division WWE3 bacterium]|uniref:Efflux RND transporter periplasmic adaptor subunit n=1 Tax=candidate division WWE3 bacterium TaxID=2053526 RepID=A0A7X9HGW3_UNCKA|nr:efflux RND transporter periplasmic adaptor subunit [candidate division WWE3 bacterium]
MNRIKSLLKNKKIWVSLLFILVVYGVYSIARRDNINTIPVKVVTIEQKVVEKTISATGEVTSVDDADLSFNSIGKIAQIYVKEGDQISKGDLLAQLDNSAISDTVQTARDARDIALRDKEYFVAKYLYNKSAAGGTEEYEISLRKYDELISQAEATLALRQTQLKDVYMYAPFKGIVYSVTKTPGELATTGETIIKVADLDQLVFEVELDQEDYGLVKQDQKVKIELDAYPNTEFTGKVHAMPLYANGGANARFKVKMSFDENASVKPLLCMTGDVHIVVAETDKPVDALFYDQIFTDENDAYYVWVVDNGLIKKQPVDVGLEGDVYYELKNKPDKQIVVGLNSDVTVKDGFKAKLN